MLQRTNFCNVNKHTAEPFIRVHLLVHNLQTQYYKWIKILLVFHSIFNVQLFWIRGQCSQLSSKSVRQKAQPWLSEGANLHLRHSSQPEGTNASYFSSISPQYSTRFVHYGFWPMFWSDNNTIPTILHMVTETENVANNDEQKEIDNLVWTVATLLIDTPHVSGNLKNLWTYIREKLMHQLFRCFYTQIDTVSAKHIVTFITDVLCSYFFYKVHLLQS